MDEITKQKIFRILKKEVNVEFDELDPKKDFRDLVNLDSMQFVAILARIEAEFDIEIPISAMEVHTLNEFLSIIDAELLKTPS
jgi:acyl carrier protein